MSGTMMVDEPKLKCERVMRVRKNETTRRRTAGLLLSLLILAGVADAAPVTIQLGYGDFGHISNPGTVCVATSMMNSFVFLKNTHGDIYNGTSLTTGTNPMNTPEQARDQLANGWGPNRPGAGGCGASAESWWEAKVQWLRDFAPNTSLVRGQEAVSDPRTWMFDLTPSFGFPTFDFLATEISRKEDVEIGIGFIGDGAHALTLTSVTFDDLNGNGMFNAGEPPLGLDYLDPDEPSQLYMANLMLQNGILTFPYRDGRNSVILVAYSESPVPEPATLFLLGSGLVGVATAVRRRRSRTEPR